MSEDTNQEQQLDAIDNLRKGNFALSEVMKDAVNIGVVKASELMEGSDDLNELLTGMKLIETAGKITGLSPREQQMNVQINAISGFEFMELEEEDIKQITIEEVYDEEA